MKILVTGGLGFIGSHTCVELLNEGHDVIVVDNLNNSKEEVFDKIKQITNNENIKLYIEDVRNKENLNKIFDENEIDLVIHFAGYKAVGESVKNPVMYYENNIGSTNTLLQCMMEHNVKKIIFSSTATVYGVPKFSPIEECFEVGNTTNPYATTKYMIERILNDLYLSDNEWGIVVLRYFNPIGAHKSGLIGENPNGIPNNLMPYILKVASGELPKLNIFGNDYETHDGTGVRDYIHVVDLAKGHVKAINKIANQSGMNTYNLGTGVGYSVLDIVNNFNKANSLNIPYEFAPRRAGDIDSFFSNPGKAKQELGWVAEMGIEEMCRDSWNFKKNNM